MQAIIVGYAIIIPWLLLNYIIGGDVSHLEFLINFVAVGGLGLRNEAYVTGLLTFAVGILFLLDFALAFKNTKFLSTTIPR